MYAFVMKYENIEEMSAEIEALISPIRATLVQAKEDLVVARASSGSVKALGDLEKFLKGLQEEIGRTQEQDKTKVALVGIARATEFLVAEQQKVRDRIVSSGERVTVLESVVAHVDSHRTALLTRKEAVERVMEGDLDERHPEKISVVREAERVKKTKKQDS